MDELKKKLAKDMIESMVAYAEARLRGEIVLPPSSDRVEEVLSKLVAQSQTELLSKIRVKQKKIKPQLRICSRCGGDFGACNCDRYNTAVEDLNVILGSLEADAQKGQE